MVGSEPRQIIGEGGGRRDKWRRGDDATTLQYVDRLEVGITLKQVRAVEEKNMLEAIKLKINVANLKLNMLINTICANVYRSIR